MRPERLGPRAALLWCLGQAGRLKREPGAGLWMGLAFCVALISAFVVLASMGAGENGTRAALRLTGRLSFVFFWPAYAGGAIAALFGSTFGLLARRGRHFGLGFASAQLVHIGLVVWLFSISARQPLSNARILFFAIGVVWTCVLAVYSVPRVRDVLNPTLWRILRTIGLEYIAVIFFFDFVLAPIQNGVRHPIAYVPFSMVCGLISSPLRALARRARYRKISWIK